jgi:lysophospholipase L1-like esterase
MPVRPQRRLLHVLPALLLGAGLAATGSALPAGAAPPATQSDEPASNVRFIAAWGATPEYSAVAPADSSVRNIARVSLNGSQVRIRVSNPRADAAPLVIGAATVAQSVSTAEDGTSAEVVPGTTRPVTFAGAPGVTVPAGTTAVYSEPIDFPVVADTNLAVTLHLPEAKNPDVGGAQWNNSFTTKEGAGDQTQEEAGAPFTEQIDSTYALTGIDVLTDEADGAIVGLGSSTLHGWNSTRDGYNRVLDLFIKRSQAELPAGQRKGIVGAGIAGDTLHAALLDGRLERDVLSQTGVTGVVVWVTNDLLTRNDSQIIEDYRIVIARAHAAGVKAYCPTWMPAAQSSHKIQERSRLNNWIMNSRECDEVVDWDRTIRNDAAPNTFKVEYFSDGIHPNPAGHAAMSADTPLSWFSAAPLPAGTACGEVLPSQYADRADVLPLHLRSVDCATVLGIATGVNGAYLPAGSVRRDQMASFIVRTIEAARGQALPAADESDDAFTDLEGNTHADSIRRLFAAGVVSAKTSTSYAPDQPVSRDQMATFLLGAAEYAAAQAEGSLASDEQRFSDVPASSTHFAQVNGAAALGLVRGVDGERYAPELDTRRDQMATFVTRLHALIAGRTLNPPA